MTWTAIPPMLRFVMLASDIAVVGWTSDITPVDGKQKAIELYGSLGAINMSQMPWISQLNGRAGVKKTLARYHVS